jgi:hypothetical protein
MGTRRNANWLAPVPSLMKAVSRCPEETIRREYLSPSMNLDLIPTPSSCPSQLESLSKALSL